LKHSGLHFTIRALVGGVSILAGTALYAQQAPGSVDFTKDVQPILSKNCTACHAGATPTGNLRLDSPEGILAGGESGKVVVPGNSKDSLLVQKVVDKSMPPGSPLSAPEIAILQSWVDQGAKVPAGALEAANEPDNGKSVGPPSPERTIVDEYCVACHNHKLKTAGLSLDRVDLSKPRDNAEIMEKMVWKVGSGMMPPPQAAKKPDFKTRQALVKGLEAELDHAAVVNLPPPGLHRMNRAEYANAIRDLLALEVDPSKFLPPDDSTRGFDNVAAALSLSPALLEGYISAAGKISRLAIGDVTGNSASTEAVYRVPGDTSQDYHVEGLPFGTRGGLVVKHEFPADGDYAFKVYPVNKGNMDNNQAFGEIRGEKLELLLDGKRVKLYDWDTEVGRGAPVHNGSKDVVVHVTAGLHTVGLTFLATNYAPGSDLDQHFLRSTIETGGLPGFTFYPHVGKLTVIGPKNATGAQDSPSRAKIFVCRPASPDKESACAREIVTTIARRAFRRPVTSNDLETLMSFYQQGRNEGGDFDHGVEMALRRILADPEFVFRKEGVPANAAPGKPYRITDLELASRLSFFLWSSIPDDELIALASQNKLHEPAVLEQQVKRMLKDPRSEALVDNFYSQWLNLRALQTVTPVTAEYPDFDDNLRQAMKKEMELFVGSIIREDHGVLELLTADYTFVDGRLARHYGIPNVYGSEFQRVSLGKEFDMRRGLLGKGALLTVTSEANRTSPVKRGKEIMQIFLGVSPPDPPPNVVIKLTGETDAHGGRKPTMREQMEAHRKNEPCASCHRIMDPIGFSLENFDAVGQWRETDDGSPIDTSGQLVDGTKLNGVADMRNALLKYSDQFIKVVTDKLMIYALGRGTEYFDMPVERSIIHQAARDNYRFSSLVIGIVRSEPFQMNMKPAEGQLRASR
jgi:cytochrome c551/c552